jgi:hypothetical protein
MVRAAAWKASGSPAMSGLPSSPSPPTTSTTSSGPRRVLIGPQHPYIKGGLPMDAGGVGHGVADLFGYQNRAFLDQIAGIDQLRPLPSFCDGLHGLQVVAAVSESAKNGGVAVKVA